MCYGDDLPTAEQTARELRQMKRLSAALCVLSAGLVGIIVWRIWRMM